MPLLLALAVGIASMPTNIYQICRRNVGTLEIEPWRIASMGGSLRAKAASLAGAIRAFFATAAGRQAAVVAATLVLMLVLSSHPHANDGLLAVVGVAGSVSPLKLYRQKDADLRAELNAAKSARAAIGTTAVAENRAMTEAERTEFTAGAAKIASIEARIKENNELLASAEAANEALRNAPSPDAPNGDVEASRTAASRAGIVVGKNNAEDDPKRGFKDHRDYLSAVMVAGRNPNRIDARLKPLAAAGSDEQGDYSDPHGGFLVPHGVAPGILSIEPEDDVLGGLVTQVPMTAPTISYNARVDKDHSQSVSGGFIVTRRPETVDGTASRQKYEQVTLTANEEFGLAFATERIITDSPTSFVAIVQAGFRDEYAANAMQERINGSGTGERQGALNTGCKIVVAKETGQKPGTILKENIDAMAARCWRYRRAVWLANHNTRAALKSLVQVVGTGGNSVPYFITDAAPAGFDGVLDGRPLVFTEFAKTLGAEGDLILMVPSEYLEGTYQTEQYAESIHVRFMAAERGFRFYRRNDGQWWWKTPLTPKNGSTLSPVVTLAVRS